MLQVRLDERGEFAVEDGLDVPHLFAGAVVLHHPIGMKDVGADLASPLDVFQLPLQFLELFRPLSADFAVA